MQHEMRLTKEPFQKIQNGTKTIESRLFDEKRQLLHEGDELVFRLTDDPNQEIKTKIVALLRYPSFKELMDAFPAESFGGKSTEANLEEIHRFYSQEDEQKYGVVGIKIVTM